MTHSYCADALIHVPGMNEPDQSWSADIFYSSDSKNEIKNKSSLLDRRFDLASLTKIIVTSTLLVELAKADSASSLLDWARNTKMASSINELKGGQLKDISLLELWNHVSGLAAVVDLVPERPDFFKIENRVEATRSLLNQVLHLPFNEQDKNQTRYSDVGFLILGIFLEKRFAKPLNEIWEIWIAKHSVSKKLPRFHANHAPSGNCLPTESKSLPGVVNDDKAYYLGGVAPHAGLFGNVSEVEKWIKIILDLSSSDSLYREWLTANPDDRFVFGWDTSSQSPTSQAGGHAPKSARGHLGYTGTALWLDPQKGSYGILLTNRICPQATEINRGSISSLRTGFFDTLWLG